MSSKDVVHTRKADRLMVEAFKKLSRARTIYRRAEKDYRVRDITSAMEPLEMPVKAISERQAHE